MAERIQLSRRKGWKMPPNTVKVDRSTRWGNPFIIGDFNIPNAAAAVDRYREWLDGRVVGPKPPSLADIRSALQGKNLACWCEPDGWCHADILLALANPSPSEKGGA